MTANLARFCSKALREHVRRALTYFEKLQGKLSNGCKEYWKNCASMSVGLLKQDNLVEDDIDTDETRNELNDSARAHNYQCQMQTLGDAEKTGMSFPGRNQYRPMIVFDQKESKQCGKRYPKSKNHSAGILTVQCACRNPKLIGFIVMTRAESTSLALSAILMFLQIIPEYIFV